jgi:hypothetical protein
VIDNGNPEFPDHAFHKTEGFVHIVMFTWVDARQEWLVTRQGVTHQPLQRNEAEIEEAVLVSARAGVRALLHRLKQYRDTGE